MPHDTRLSRELWLFLLAGTFFGVLITKAEVISWFRIQEMFRFQGFHMFGIFATAMPVAIISVQLIKRGRVRSLAGEPITSVAKARDFKRYAIGGTIFGVGWALTGACPGPLFALFGSGVSLMAAVIVSALAGTRAYGALRHRLPH